MENDKDSKFVLKFSNLLHYNKKVDEFILYTVVVADHSRSPILVLVKSP